MGINTSRVRRAIRNELSGIVQVSRFVPPSKGYNTYTEREVDSGGNCLRAVLTVGGGISAVIKEGLLELEVVDVIVNVTRPDMRLDCGGVSSAILKAAGSEIQEECDRRVKRPLKPGDVVVTSGGRLPVKAIFHGWCSAWEEDIPSLQTYIHNILVEAEARGYYSIALPAIGTGGLKYPPHQVALVMAYEMASFSYTHPNIRKDVRIIIHRSDHDTLEAFMKLVSDVQRLTSDGSLTSGGGLYDDSQSEGVYKRGYQEQYDGRSQGHYGYGYQDDEAEDIGDNWTEMNSNKLYERIPVQKGSQEYIKVAEKFKVGTIVSIERMQNPVLLRFYQHAKKEMEMLNPNIKNEWILYHGTSFDSLENINSHGFNRSYCGKNATRFGDGVYFAINLDLPADPVFSPEDPKGNRYIYQARVLVGKSIIGKQSLKEPPFLPDSSGRRYDSVHGYGETVYVVFKDYAAYPEYIITFRKKVPSQNH